MLIFSSRNISTPALLRMRSIEKNGKIWVALSPKIIRLFCLSKSAVQHIYDDFWKKKNGIEEQHSKEAIDLMVDFIAVLQEIPDGCAE